METQQNQQGTCPLSLCSSSRGRVIALLIGIVLIAGLISLGIWRQRYVTPKNFAEVIPEHLYRSAAMEARPMKRILDQHKIHTILTLLAYDPKDPLQEQEIKIAKEKNIRLERIGLPKNGCGKFEDLERGAAIIANESTHPLLVHCAAGSNRTGAVVAVWRMKYCGWDFDRTFAEVEKYTPISDELKPHLKQFYQERIVATRPAKQESATTQSTK
ncbi:MAG: tyrosine-protein phosphatase [Phycisphaerae bacterium]|nr:tyrosine-protein phosphatase [Phycisphaerae bacterium]